MKGRKINLHSYSANVVSLYSYLLRLFFEASYSLFAIILTVWTLVGFVPGTPVLGMQAE